MLHVQSGAAKRMHKVGHEEAAPFRAPVWLRACLLQNKTSCLKAERLGIDLLLIA